ncbi:acetylcholine receptor subunit beta-type acr-3-like [Dreissena polymorpha]|uniref:acetylcholine receptor subunit beta-type acr-3-like n=1 Tax=Dreissena polymorpha TaxID=45954 RepID=UPI0022645BC0|nr:acetylcholine receptor subunit beta-type acr-3-like [Dreissena polymorpha]
MCFWIDEIMTWDPANHSNIQKVHFKEEEIWHPSLLLATPNKFTLAGGYRQRIKIQANGNAKWLPGEVWESSCRFNMKFWPFDKQTCEIEFINLDFSAEEVQLHHLLFNQDNFVPNSEWTLEGLSATTLTRLNLSVIRYSFKLKRESTFYVLTLILPITFLGISSVMVFLLPAESGERVGFSITLMLTMTTFLDIVSDVIPKTATPPSLMAVFVFLLVMFSIIVLILSILTLMIYHRSDDIKIHRNYITIFKLSSFAFCCKTKENRIGTSDEIRRDGVKIINIESAKKSELVADEQNLDAKEIKWPDISNALDTICFYTLTPFSILLTNVFLFYLSFASHY